MNTDEYQKVWLILIYGHLVIGMWVDRLDVIHCVIDCLIHCFLSFLYSLIPDIKVPDIKATLLQEHTVKGKKHEVEG